jgi:hypothetical protein
MDCPAPRNHVSGHLNLGDPGYAMQADADYVAGHITDDELRELLTLDALVARSRGEAAA